MILTAEPFDGGRKRAIACNKMHYLDDRTRLSPGAQSLSFFGLSVFVLVLQLFLVVVKFLNLGFGGLLGGPMRGNLGILGAYLRLHG